MKNSQVSTKASYASHPVRVLLTCVTLAGIVAGCANGNFRDRFKAGNGIVASNLMPSSNGLSVGCDEYNIFPIGQSSIFGENEFMACASLSNPFSVEIEGNSTYSPNGQVCVFPVDYRADGTAVLYPANNNSGHPYLMQCGTVSNSAPATLTFQGISYNSLLVVGATQVAAFEAFLYSGANPAFAPPYSAGRFR